MRRPRGVPVLQREDVVHPPVDLLVAEVRALVRVDVVRRDPDGRPDLLERTPDDPLRTRRAPELRGDPGVHRASLQCGLEAAALRRVVSHDLHARDLSQVRAHRLGDAGRQPVGIRGAREIRELQHEDPGARCAMPRHGVQPCVGGRRRASLGGCRLQGGDEGASGGEALGRRLCERAGDRERDAWREHLAHGGEGRWWAAEVLAEDHEGVRAGEGHPASQHLVAQAAQGVHVAAAVQLTLGGRLLGAHVLRRAEGHAHRGERRRAACRIGCRPVVSRPAGGPEVRQQRVRAAQEQVLGLEVAVDDAACMGVVEGLVSRSASRLRPGRCDPYASRRRCSGATPGVGTTRVEASPASSDSGGRTRS